MEMRSARDIPANAVESCGASLTADQIRAEQAAMIDTDLQRDGVMAQAAAIESRDQDERAGDILATFGRSSS